MQAQAKMQVKSLSNILFEIFLSYSEICVCLVCVCVSRLGNLLFPIFLMAM